MSEWTADFVNDPYHNYELTIEILHNKQDVGVIKKGKNGLELIWFAHKDNHTIPFDWLLTLMNEANKKL